MLLLSDRVLVDFLGECTAQEPKGRLIAHVSIGHLGR
jgi:hypothetical protein